MSLIIAFVFTFLGFAFSVFFLIYGVKAGILEKHILAAHPNHYDEGKAAIQRGILYVVIGLFFLAGSSVSLLSIIYKIK